MPASKNIVNVSVSEMSVSCFIIFRDVAMLPKAYYSKKGLFLRIPMVTESKIRQILSETKSENFNPVLSSRLD